MSLTGIPTLGYLGFDNPPENPLMLLGRWLETADNTGVSEPRGFVLSIVNAYGKPSSRIVSLTASDERAIIFTTSKESAKRKDLEFNRQAVGTLWRRETIQQINFTGQVNQLLKEQADDFFKKISREAQAVSAISRQSSLLTDESKLRSEVTCLINTQNKIERPKNWLAYHLILESIEFWQGNKGRFHTRLRYDLTDGLWVHCRLQP